VANVADEIGWKMAVGPHNVGPQVEVFKARDRKLSFKVDDSDSLSFTLDGDDPVWAYITELVTDVWMYRNNKVFYRGRVGPTNDTIDEDSNVVSVNTFGYKEWLSRQILGPTAKLTWTDKTRAVIIQDMLNYVNAQPGLKPQILLDSTRLSTNITDFDVLPGTSVKDAVNAMTGFGWQVIPEQANPKDPGDLILKAVSPFYYVLNDYFVMEYGGVIAKVTRQLDTAGYGNVAFVSGDMNLAPAMRSSADIATNPRGPLGVVVSDPSIVSTKALTSRADQEITEHNNIAADWKVDFVPGGWINEDDAWLGDICRFVVNSGRINVNDFYRITEFDLSISDDGEDHTVTATVVKPPYVPTS